MRTWVVVCVVAFGCGGEGGEEELGPECTAISDACHEAEEAGDARGIECHDLAHAADEDACATDKDACLTDCGSSI